MRKQARAISRDEGITLTELLVAMGVFGVLMAIVGSGFISVFSGIRDATAFSGVQQDERNSMLFISRAIRYIDNESEGFNSQPAILSANATEFAFFTNAGLGLIEGVPDRVRLNVVAGGTNPGLTAVVAEPNLTDGVVSGYTDSTPLVLMRTTSAQDPVVTFTYLRVVEDASGARVDEEYIPPVTDDSAVFLAWAADIDKVRVRLADSLSGIFTEQTIVLVNQR
jgi:Tfp pilus assembly protein PilW